MTRNIPQFLSCIKPWFVSVMLLLVVALEAEPQPNIVLILADDLGMGDLGCYGAADIASPHIDQIASEGIRFERNYAYPVCSPSRASILTGRWAENHGITSALMGDGGLAPQTLTVAQRLRSAGYRTGLIGKWHLGYALERGPNQLGFERFFGFRGGKIDYFLHRDSAQRDENGSPLGHHDLWSDEVEVHRDGEYATELFTQEAVRFIRQSENDARPFFLVVAYNAPHYARPGVLQAPAEYVARFAADPSQPSPREIYRAMVACMDDGVGEVRAALRQIGADENTLLIFASDNGADLNHGGSNGIFREGKWTVFEGGIRVPLVARWPGHIPADTRSAAVLHCADLAPTMLHAAGVGEAMGDDFDGIDTLPAWLDAAVGTPSRRLRFAFRGRQAVIDGRWKQIRPTGADEADESMLYDLEQDPAETTDVSAQHPAIEVPLAFSPLFGDHAVLQRGRPVTVWGEGEPGATLTLSFGDQRRETVVGADGRWRVELAPMPASGVGRDLVARVGGASIVAHDVVVGEVWLCSGQSNMARTLTADYDVGETGSPDRPLVRQFMVDYAPAATPADQVSGAWATCTPETIVGFSSVAYYFASEVGERLQVPVGVVVAAVGGTRVEAWMPEAALATASFADVRAKWDRYLAELPAATVSYEQAYAQWQRDAEAARLAGKTFTVRRPFPPLGAGSKLALSALFNGMIFPLLDYQARGVLWYQGEYNTRDPFGYADLFAAMITSWRQAFGDAARPFYWVQLANHERPEDMPGSWARLRDAQTSALALPHTGQAVAIDIGEAGDIHPRNKWDVGDRLARIALALDYGVAVAWRGPSFAWATRDGPELVVHFDDAAGLHSRGGEVEAFEVAGADGVFHPARAQVLRSAVRVSAAEVTDPVAVRYAWSNAPRANLYNRAGLPAGPFFAVVETDTSPTALTRN